MSNLSKNHLGNTSLPDEDFDVENLGLTKEEEEESTELLSENIISYTQLFSISSLKDKWKSKFLEVPNFQRSSGLWSIKNKASFIESLLLNLPVPSIVVYEEFDKYYIIDGLQRISSIMEFLDNDFCLKNFIQIKTKKFNEKRYNNFSEQEKENFKNKTIAVTTVSCQDPSQERHKKTYYEIFRRLNQGGLILTPQEIRNGVYPGIFTNFLKKIRENVIWQKLYIVLAGKNFKLNRERQRDTELLLKIFALHEKKYEKKGLADFLNTYVSGANKKSSSEIKELDSKFLMAMQIINKNDLISLFSKKSIKSQWAYYLLVIRLMQNADILSTLDRTTIHQKVQELTEKVKAIDSKDTWAAKKVYARIKFAEELL